MRVARRHLLGGAGLCLAAAARAEAPPVQLYAAMIFRRAVDAVLAAYRDSGGAAVAVYGPTPLLVRQIEAGAPADIFLSADPDWMDDATRRGLIDEATRRNLAGNALVLAGPAGAVSLGELTAASPLGAVLGAGRLAMCDPEHDPAGRYAKQGLTALGFWQAVAPRIAIAESAPAAVAMLDRGEVAAAIGFATDLQGDDRATEIGRFPAASHAPIVYPVALTRASRSPQAADALRFLCAPAALRIFAGFGYLPAA